MMIKLNQLRAFSYETRVRHEVTGIEQSCNSQYLLLLNAGAGRVLARAVSIAGRRGPARTGIRTDAQVLEVRNV